MSEQSLERQHRIFNHLGRLYSTIQKADDRLRTTFKQAHLQSLIRTIVMQ
jgi:hypothetical protein